MSRIGKNPVKVEDKVQVSIVPGKVSVKGAKGSLVIPFNEHVTVETDGSEILVKRRDDSQRSRAMHGLYRSLLQNAMTGVSKGFQKTLVMNGVGYRGALKGKVLELNLGFSHPISYQIPEGIEIEVEKQTTIHVRGASKELVGQVSAQIRGFRPPEPYLGKGVKYSDEVIRRKEGKSAGK